MNLTQEQNLIVKAVAANDEGGMPVNSLIKVNACAGSLGRLQY